MHAQHAQQAQIQAFFDQATATVTYVVHQGRGSACAIIDPVLDYEAASGRTATVSADRVIAYVREHGLRLDWLLETHAHADHLSGAPYIASRLGGRTGIGEAIGKVRKSFSAVFPHHGSLGEFDHLFAPDEQFAIGGLTARAIHVPGHTPADMAFHIGDAVFVGDTLFMPDVGTARCDFPGGDAAALYQSVRRILELPADTRLFMCHDYPPAGRGPAWESTVAAQRAHNIHLRDGISQDDFVAMRTRRDDTLAMPALILPAIQVNLHAGRLPPPEGNGVRYLKIPLNAL
ncbi:MBL fold metallo-hydrolase [Massilia sp. PAMC28688]|uniref:MBL fold metallo-hydrolase n=1 Tax=Massilia sp. PAMC28688 TaxID=2861283 RepID=UPI001C62DE9E|nr:MBL fold metallo-hydrolase [Massilia sp. PAMC28688]QYF93352.1 MBL fold metallo-hydrolase [Massilia sp. PAMC28688]